MLWTRRRSQKTVNRGIRDRGSWSPNGRGRTWSKSPQLPTRASWSRPLALLVVLVCLIGTAGASVVYQRISAAKLAKAEAVLREMGVEEGWSDERLDLLISKLHARYKGDKQ